MDWKDLYDQIDKLRRNLKEMLSQEPSVSQYKALLSLNQEAARIRAEIVELWFSRGSAEEVQLASLLMDNLDRVRSHFHSEEFRRKYGS